MTTQQLFDTVATHLLTQRTHLPESVLTGRPSARLSTSYGFIDTRPLVETALAAGFQVTSAMATRSRRDPASAKHMVRLRHPDAIGNNAEVPEIILLNSHDGTSSYQLLAGFFRMVCSNGLIAGNVQNDVRIRHSGNIVDDVIEGSSQVIENVNALAERIDAYTPDLVILAGFMRILTPGFVSRYAGRLLNIHPSLLPKYPGLHTHQRAIDFFLGHQAGDVVGLDAAAVENAQCVRERVAKLFRGQPAQQPVSLHGCFRRRWRI